MQAVQEEILQTIDDEARERRGLIVSSSLRAGPDNMYITFFFYLARSDT